MTEAVAGPARSGSASPDRWLLVANPFGGGGLARRDVPRWAAALQGAGLDLELRWTERPGHAQDLAASWSGPILVAGGDGTLREAVDGILSRPGSRSLGLLPAGTGNALARELDLRGPDEAIRRLIAGEERPFDVMAVTLADGRVLHALDLVGLGLAADAAARAERLRRLGPARYTWGSAWSLIARGGRGTARVTIDGLVIPEPCCLVAVCNTRYTGASLLLAPGARFDDGLLDVVLVPRAGRLRLSRLFRDLQRGRHVGGEGIHIERGRRVVVEQEGGEAVNLDGDLLASGSLVVEVLPGALRLAV